MVADDEGSAGSSPPTPRPVTRAFDFDVLDVSEEEASRAEFLALEAMTYGAPRHQPPAARPPQPAPVKTVAPVPARAPAVAQPPPATLGPKPHARPVGPGGPLDAVAREQAAMPEPFASGAWTPLSDPLGRRRELAAQGIAHAVHAQELGEALPEHLSDRSGVQPPFHCICVGAPWVPIREQPTRYSKVLGAITPGEEVAFLDVKMEYALVEKVNKQGKTVSGWSPLNDECFKPADPRQTLEDMKAWDTEEHEELPQDLGYGDGVHYWDSRYKEDTELFDWIGLGYQEISGVFEEATCGKKECRILHVGCGTSVLPEQLYDVGYTRITNIDIAPQVVHQMRLRNTGKRRGMIFRVGDATNLVDFKDAMFDLVLDKTVLDTFACCEQRGLVIGDYLAECSRVLRDGGAMLIVSMAKPEERAPFIEEAPHCDFTVEVSEIEMPSGKGTACILLARKGLGRRQLLPWPELRATIRDGGPPWWGNE